MLLTKESLQKMTSVDSFIWLQSIFSISIVKATQHNIHHRLVMNTAHEHFFDKSLLTVIKFLNIHRYM